VSLSSSPSQASPWPSLSALAWLALGTHRAVVLAVSQAVAVVVVVAGVAEAVRVEVGLVGVGLERAVVVAVGHAVAVVVVVAEVAEGVLSALAWFTLAHRGSCR
jgi:hypothetical protein